MSIKLFSDETYQNQPASRNDNDGDFNDFIAEEVILIKIL